MNSKALGRRIYAARKERGITAEKLAQMCDTNPTYMRQIEIGKTPSLPLFVTICQQLQVSPHYLLGEDLAQSTNENLDFLTQSMNTATPQQTELVVAMIRSAVNVLEK